MHLRVNLLLHVVVLVVHRDAHRSLAVFFVHGDGLFLDEVLSFLKPFAVVVADNIAQLGLFDVALYAQQMVEALVAFGLFGRLVFWHPLGKLGSQPVGVDHLSLGIARMHAHALDGNLGRGCVEVLKLQVAQVAAVHRIGPLASETLHVEVVGAHADFLIGIEGDADVAVANLLVVAQPAHGLHNFSNAGLVVGSQQRGAVGHDKVFANMLQQFGELLRSAHDARAQLDVVALIVSDNLRLHVFSRAVGRRVVV